MAVPEALEVALLPRNEHVGLDHKTVARLRDGLPNEVAMQGQATRASVECPIGACQFAQFALFLHASGQMGAETWLNPPKPKYWLVLNAHSLQKITTIAAGMQISPSVRRVVAIPSRA